MTEEIINSDGSRNWQANILLDNVKRLEQENKELKEENIEYDEELAIEKLSHKSDLETLEHYRSALEEIRKIIKSYDLTVDNGASVDTLYTIRKIINEVLGNECN